LREGLQNSDQIARRSPLAALGKLRTLIGGRGIWALGDQAILSLGNFLTNILLIRNLPRNEFGVYAVLFSLLLFLNNLHTSLVTYPLSVISSTGELLKHRKRTARSVGLTLLLGIPFFLIVAGATRSVATFSLLPAVVAAMVFWQIQETLRRAMMARLQHKQAILGDAVSYLGQAAALWYVIHHGTLNPAVAFTAIAITSAIAALIQAIQWKFFFTEETPAPAAQLESGSTAEPLDSILQENFLSQAFEHWSLGRWVLFSNLISLITVYATPWILMYFHGSGDVAIFQALDNLPRVSNPILSSMAGLIVPAAAIAATQGGALAARRAATGYATQGAIMLFPYFAILALMPHTALRLFYGPDSPYLAYTTPLRLMVAVYSIFYVSQMVSAFLNGLGHGRWTFYAQIGAAIGNATFCLPMAALVGVTGAIVGGVIPMLAQLGIGLYFAKSLFSPPKPAGFEPVFAGGVLEAVPEAAR
jgi:O-antigen/teichoic acid export membrane protein